MTVAKPKVASTASCCTCATLLTDVPHLGESEKSLPTVRWLDCCPRAICGRCIHENPRFNSYCPYCQISTIDTILPPGLRDPPSYTSSAYTASTAFDLSPPPYTPTPPTDLKLQGPLNEKSALQSDESAEDILHFLNHAHDSINSLSLLYGVPASALRRANNIASDHLIFGRRTVVIPGQYYKGGVSLSPRPIEGEEEERRKAKIRRWMVSCKVHEYDVALLYLEQAGYDLQMATDAYFADEEWERTHPADKTKRGKSIANMGSGTLRARER
ncbi:hypothetical protein SAMD00023353_1502220 [Rosellinia necatrix]|uniref:LysM domain-containing protein n=1 Tax=Rosellinia necatrix TaxID=77044 RepID=A0A1W2TRC9_ROSNE|nr:hypothetical protein SAMD00023353_1502220 [Rosellinia necatrix]